MAGLVPAIHDFPPLSGDGHDPPVKPEDDVARGER
jgi:hypothetical protein